MLSSKGWKVSQLTSDVWSLLGRGLGAAEVLTSGESEPSETHFLDDCLCQQVSPSLQNNMKCALGSDS